MHTLSFDQLPQTVCELFNKVENIERLLQQIPTNTTSDADELLNIQQASSFIFLKIPTIYGPIARNAIPVMKRNKRCYFSKQELTDWIKQGKKKTIAEIHTEAENFLSNHKSGKTK